MGQFSVLSKKQSSETWIRDYNHGCYKDLYGINKMLKVECDQLLIIKMLKVECDELFHKQDAVAPKRTWGPLIFISKFKFL